MRGKLGPTTVGFVFYLPAVGIAPSTAELRCNGSAKSHAVKRRRWTEQCGRACQGSRTERKADHEYVEQLADCATDINYVDDEQGA